MTIALWSLPPQPLGALNLRREAQLGCLYDRAYVWGLAPFLLPPGHPGVSGKVTWK